MRFVVFKRMVLALVAFGTAAAASGFVQGQEPKPTGENTSNPATAINVLAEAIDARAAAAAAGNQAALAWTYVLAGDENAAGASLEPVDESLRAQLDLPKKQGLVVTSVTPDSPAAQSGLKANDILLTLGDAPLASTDDLTKTLKASGEKEISLKIIRSGKPVTIQIKPTYRVTFGPAGKEQSEFYIGLPVRAVDDAIRTHLSLPSGQGLVVTDVLADSPASKAGLKPYDILLEVGDKPVADTAALVAQIQASEGKPISVKVIRAGKPQTIQVVPERRPRKADANAQTWRLATPYVTAQPFQNFQFHPQNQEAFAKYSARLNSFKGEQQSTFNPTQASAAASPAASKTGSLEKKVDDLKKEIQAMHKSLKAIEKALDEKK